MSCDKNAFSRWRLFQAVRLRLGLCRGGSQTRPCEGSYDGFPVVIFMQQDRSKRPTRSNGALSFSCLLTLRIDSDMLSK